LPSSRSNFQPFRRPGVARSRNLEGVQLRLQLVRARQLFQVVTHCLSQALSHGAGGLASLVCHALVD
jgi:hypothetical protein